MDLLQKASQFAMDAHREQKRKSSGIPYVTHCFEVMKRMSNYGVEDKNLLSAALLHDVIEDCPNFVKRMRSSFHDDVYQIVKECSRPEGDEATKHEKFEFLKTFQSKSNESLILKIADRYCNVYDYLNTPEKEGYASQYALQAFPLYSVFLQRVSMNQMKFSEYIMRKVLEDIMILWYNIIARVYDISAIKIANPTESDWEYVYQQVV